VATRTPAQSQGRQGSGNGNGTNNGSMDVGVHAVARMAREDTRWFVAGVVVMAIVLFLALPISALVVVDYLKMKSEMQYEIRQLKKLKKELKEANEKNTVVKPTVTDGV
jgi:uncharacterized membrane protein (DUF106 family)